MDNQNNYQQQYQSNVQYTQYQAPEQFNPTVSVKEWLGAMFICLIPFVNIIMILVWAFSGGSKPSKSNYFKASLLFSLIIWAITILLIVLLSLAGVGVMEAMMNY